MIAHQTKAKKLSGTSLGEVTKQARKLFHELEKKTKRKVYIRSAYFNRQKIFFDNFWDHLYQKSPKERFRRLGYFKVAIELIEQSRQQPTCKINPNKPSERLYRFAGQTKEKEIFYVQIKEKIKSKSKYFMSVFSPE